MNEELTPLCYLVIECSMFEGYYFNCSKVFLNRNDAESYITTLNEDGVFDIKELELI
jgi:hypothetical protein